MSSFEVGRSVLALSSSFKDLCLSTCGILLKVIPLSQMTVKKIETVTEQDGRLQGKMKEREQRVKPLQTSLVRDGLLKCKAHPSPGHKDMHAWTWAADSGHTLTVAVLQTPEDVAFLHLLRHKR